MRRAPLVVLLAADGAAFAEGLRAAGMDARVYAPVQFEPADQAPARDALRTPGQWAGLILTSPRAVDQLGPDAFAAWAGDVWVVGPRTAAAAEAAGLRPRGADAGAAAMLAEAIVRTAQPSGRPFLFLCGDRRRDDLPGILRDAGRAVHECVVYRTRLAPPPLVPAGVVPDAVAFFSPSGVEAALEDPAFPWQARRIALGPTTAEALGRAGHPATATAPAPTPDALLSALLPLHA